jgi:S-DNA-T family DNA segregation ATPase FtsK/SpoIIIE
MAKKQRKVKKKDKAKLPREPRMEISGEAKREIAAIVLITIAVFLILSMIGFAGSLGGWIFMAVSFVIGLAAFVLPFALLLIAWVLFQPDKYEFKPNNLFGTIFVFVCLAGLAHLIFAPESVDFASVGNGGGMVGLGLGSAMLPILNKPVSIFILTALLMISLVVAANTRVKDLFKSFLALFHRERNSEGEVVEQSEFKINTTLPIKGSVGEEEPEPKKKASVMLTSVDKDWVYPPLDLVKATSTQADPGDAKATAKLIQSTFGDFGYEVDMHGVDVGPTVSQYSLRPPNGVNLNKITALDRNLALALEAEQIRIEAPIPGKSLVGIQVPNKKAATVRLGDILASKEVSGKGTKLTFVLGRDVSGEIITADLGKAPHLLVAGATGAGKSVMINTLITSLLYRNSPSELKLILVDPKRVELGLYQDIPHLLTPVIVEPMQAISALKWAVAEMDRRYRLLQDHGKRGIDEFNAQKDVDSMPYIVIVVDEFADLMMVAGKDVEALIQRLTQMARAVGIHLVLATQRPSVNVITGIIKANVPTRVALTTASQVDSRTIIEMAGAEKLLGKGDMLFASPSFIKPKRVQGVWLSEEEVKGVADYLRSAREPEYNEEVLAQSVRIKGVGGGDYDTGEDDLFNDAAEAVIQGGKASASYLQRRLKVGYARAARLMDMLEEQGVVGPPDGAKPREVLISSVDELGGGGGMSDSED